MIRNIQFLRGAAALMVVGVHLNPLLPVPAPNGGVDLFFVISGFIMAHTAKDAEPAAFAGRRIRRIVPLYWLLTLFTFACALMVPGLFKHTVADAESLAKSLLFIPFIKGAANQAQPLLFVGWTLNYEMAFYAIFAAGLALRRPVLVASGLLCLSALAGLFTGPGFYTDPIIIEFALGMGAAAFYRRRRLPAPALWAILSLPFVLYADRLFPAHRLLTNGFPAAAFLLAMVEIERHGRVFGGRIGQLVGAASYSIYLTHPFVTAATVAIWRWARLPAPIMTLAGLAVAIAIGLLIWRFIERPMAEWLRSAHRKIPLRAALPS